MCPRCSVELRLFKENTNEVEGESISVTSADLRVRRLCASRRGPGSS